MAERVDPQPVPRSGLGAKLRKLHAQIRTPRDLLLLARMTSWAVVLPILKRRVQLANLVRLVADGRAGRERNPAREEQVVKLAGWLFRFRKVALDDNCLERSLLMLRFLGKAGADATLEVGVRKDDGVVLAHAWITIDGEPVYDPGEYLAQFTPLVSYGADGAQLSGDPGAIGIPAPFDGSSAA